MAALYGEAIGCSVPVENPCQQGFVVGLVFVFDLGGKGASFGLQDGVSLVAT